jgi:hypothetical protein
MRLFILFLVLLCMAFPALAGETGGAECYPITAEDLADGNAPAFEQFPAGPVYKGKPAPLQPDTYPFARSFSTLLSRGAEKGPNFAGHYTVVGWGIGRSSTAFAIVDAKTGKVFSSNRFMAVYQGLGYSHDVVEAFMAKAKTDYQSLYFRLDSRLLIAVGALDGDEESEGAFYFSFEDGELKPVYSVKVKKIWCKDMFGDEEN